MDPATAADATTEGAETTGETGAAELSADEHYRQSLADALAETGEVDAPEGEEPSTEGEPAKPPEAKKDDKPAEPAAEPEDIKLRREWTAIARERGKARDRERAADQAIQQAQSFQAKAQAHDQLVTRLREDPRAVLVELGGEPLVDAFLNATVAAEKSPAEREIAKLRQEIEARDRQNQQNEQTRAIQEWRAGVVRTVEAGGEAYDLINSLGQHEAVIDVMGAYYQKYQTALPVELAAQAVEKTLSDGLSKSKRFGQTQPVKPASLPAKNGTSAPAKKTPVSLSSVGAGEVPASDDDLPMDPSDRFAHVMRGLVS